MVVGFFLILPFGIEREGEVKFGNDPGAPKILMLKKKYLFHQLLLCFLTLILIVIIKNEIF